MRYKLLSRRFLATIFAVILALGVGPTSLVADNRGNHRGDNTVHVRGGFEVTIHRGPDAGLVVMGVLDVNVDRESGSFTGNVIPALDESTNAPFTSVLFRAPTTGGGALTPVSPPVTEIRARGTIRGHAVNMVLLDVGGPGKHIFGVGTTENDVGEEFTADPGILGGPAVGPNPGDQGDWCSCILSTRTGFCLLHLCCIIFLGINFGCVIVP